MTFHFNDPNLWFLMDLFAIEILFYFLDRCIKQRGLLVLILIMLYAATRFIPVDNRYCHTVRSSMYYALFFCAGFFGISFLNRFRSIAFWGSFCVVLLVGLVLGERDGSSPLKDIVYLISGVCGAYAVIQAGKMLEKMPLDQALSLVGKNTITIYGTHHIIYAGLGILLGVHDFASTPIVPGLVILLGVAILEIPVVYIINRWMPFLAGKHRPRLTASNHVEGIKDENSKSN